jgi:hypothetical protein
MEMTMTTYKDVWDSMNELDMMTSKLGYVKTTIDTALEAIDNRDYQKAESLMFLCSEFVEYYLQDYDTKFQRAWATTTTIGKELDDVRAKLSRLENPDNPQYTDEEMEAMTNQNYIKDLLE